MSYLIVRGSLLARIGLPPLLLGVVPQASCYRSSTPIRHDATAGRPAAAEHRRQIRDGEPLPRRFSGVVVARTPTGGVSIRLVSAMVGGGPPLYVIDGAPILADPSRGFDWLKPEDIEGITVLKNPAEIAVYGPRGANGVILVTTKQDQTRRKDGR